MKITDWTKLAAAALVVAACSKKPDESARQELAAPAKSEAVAAQAEVRSSSGPIEISLLVKETTIRKGDHVSQTIRIRNVGASRLVVADQSLGNDDGIREASRLRYGIYLEALGPDGGRLDVTLPAYPDLEVLDRDSTLLDRSDPELRKRIDQWKGKGLSSADIDRRVADYNLGKRIPSERLSARAVVALAPGESTETGVAREAPARPGGSKTQSRLRKIEFFDFGSPGEYRIRAVFDHRRRALSRKFKSLHSEADVLVSTPWITLTVVP